MQDYPTLQVAEAGLSKVEELQGGQYEATAPLAPPLQIPTPHELLIKQHLQCALIHPNHSPPAAQGGRACTPRESHNQTEEGKSRLCHKSQKKLVVNSSLSLPQRCGIGINAVMGFAAMS